MLAKTKKFLKIFYDAGHQTVHDDGIEHAGYLAFLGILAIFPALIFLLALAGNLGNQESGAEFIKQLYNIIPASVAETLAPQINDVLSGPPQGILTIAAIGLLWTASGAVEGIRTILNRVYHVMNPPHFLLRRALSILQFIVLIFIVIIAMFFLTLAPALMQIFEDKIHVNINLEPELSTIRFFGSALALFVGISASFYVLPNIKQSIIRVAPGAVLCVILWLLTIYGFRNFVGYFSNISNIYGSLAGVIITLIFFYVLGIIYIYSAEFNFFLEKYLGHRIEQKE